MSLQWTRREFGFGAAGVGLTLGMGARRVAEGEQAAGAAAAAQTAAARAVADPYALVDPEYVAALKQFPASVDLTVEMAKQVRQMAAMAALPAPAPQPVERHVPGAEGAPEVRVWMVDPAPTEKGKPVLLHMHGGGFMMPDTMLLPRLQAIATDCRCVVVSVDYRLAPETRYTGAVEDNYAALKWVYAHAAELGIDRSKIAVGGESAGGYHAASLAIAARDRKEVPVMFQLLIYAALDDRTGSTREAPPAVGHFIWNASANRLAWGALLGVAAGSASVPAAAVPARVPSVAGLPPAWIGVGALDLFADEDMEYARRLVQAGVGTELLVVPGVFHGFDGLVPEADASKGFRASWTAALRRAFAAGKAVPG